MGQRQRRGRRGRPAVERSDGDPPPALPGRRLADGDVAACGHERALHPCAAQHLERAIGGITLGDAPEIEAHARTRQRYRAGRRVKPHERGPAHLPCGRDVTGIRQLRLPPCAAPQVRQRPHRDVEGAA